MLETLIVAAILGVVMAGLLLSITTSGRSWLIGTATLEVRSEVRRAAEWIKKDIRQAYMTDLVSIANDPSSSHVRFRTVTGYDPATQQLLLSDNYLDYTFDQDNNTITRSTLSSLGWTVVNSWTFRNIIEPPFFTKIIDINGSIIIAPIDPEVGRTESPVLQTRNMVVRVVGQKTVLSGYTPVITMAHEVKLRNE